VISKEKSVEETLSGANLSGELSWAPATGRPHRKPITPEQRRILGQPRSWRAQAAAREKCAQTAPRRKMTEEMPREKEAAHRMTRRRSLSRTSAMQNFAIAISLFLLFGMIFYIGKRYEYWKYMIVTHRAAKVSANESKKFPGSSAEELVNQALIAERLGNWQEAVDRYISAKYKNLAYSGLLFHVGKIYYDHSDFTSADAALERAIAFGENIDSANYYRGMIALGREDLPAAERFFEAASNAAPFNADYVYSWAETLRKGHHPHEAIARYEQAAVRAGGPEETICRFKTRMATVETGDVAQLSAELEKKSAEGPLSVDWLMTAAALRIRSGGVDAAIVLVREARAIDQSRLFSFFAACAGDRFFTNACRGYPDLAQVCRVEAAPASAPH
jgi:tetratricopeptide (TPR) repeat protein